MSTPTLNPTAIRLDLVARLTGKTAAGANVYDTRNVAWLPANLPALSVTSISGNNTRLSQGSDMHRHVEDVVVSAELVGNDEAAVAAAMDAIQAEVEDVLMCDDEWLSAFESVDGPDVRREIGTEGNRLIGSVQMKFSVQYTIQYERKAPDCGDLDHVYITTTTPTDPAVTLASRRDLLQEGDDE